MDSFYRYTDELNSIAQQKADEEQTDQLKDLNDNLKTEATEHVVQPITGTVGNALLGGALSSQAGKQFIRSSLNKLGISAEDEDLVKDLGTGDPDTIIRNVTTRFLDRPRIAQSVDQEASVTGQQARAAAAARQAT